MVAQNRRPPRARGSCSNRGSAVGIVDQPVTTILILILILTLTLLQLPFAAIVKSKNQKKKKENVRHRVFETSSQVFSSLFLAIALKQQLRVSFWPLVK